MLTTWSWALVCANLATAAKLTGYILAPVQRSVSPSSIYATHGDVTNAKSLIPGGHASSRTRFGANASVTLDFGKNIAGTVRFNVRSVTGTNEYLGFAFTESSMWISPYHGDSASVADYDDPQWFRVPRSGQYAADKFHQRGGFRYLSVWHNGTGSVTLEDLAIDFTASPEMADLQDYTGYFNSDNEKLNRVWYAGAYTNQLCNIDPTTGNALGVLGTDWHYNYTISNGTSVLVDGAKRDCLVWPGDLIISAPSVFVSTNRLDSIKNGIDSLFLLQQPDGRLPWAGVPFTSPGNFPFSFTYHLYTLLDVHRYWLYTGDLDYVRSLWGQYNRALAWSVATIDESHLANVTSSNDWLRSGMAGHNIEANAILYHTLSCTLQLAAALNDHAQDTTWSTAMSGIKSAANALLWDPSASLYFDNDANHTSTAIHPQDGNAWAILANLTLSPSQSSLISAALATRWIRPYGAPAPEAGATISPFASGLELQAHFLARHPERAVELIEFMWADFMLDDPRMTGSSFVEGYSTDGSIHYAPYGDQDARISHAHGWSTAPTAALSFYLAGMQVVEGGGREWLVQPGLGGVNQNVTRVEAGFETGLGQFEVRWTLGEGGGLSGEFSTPEGTEGRLVLSASVGSKAAVVGPKGVLKPSASSAEEVRFENLPGGSYVVRSIV